MMNPVRRVMLIDDDELLRDMYAKKFRDKGLEGEALDSAQEALERLRAGAAPDFIVFDIVMPGLDGFALLEAMRTEGLAPKAVRVALTNQGADEDKERALALGTAAYLIKASLTPSTTVEAVLKAAGEKAEPR